MMTRYEILPDDKFHIVTRPLVMQDFIDMYMWCHENLTGGIYHSWRYDDEVRLGLLDTSDPHSLPGSRAVSTHRVSYYFDTDTDAVKFLLVWGDDVPD